jgi:DNA helicase-2/ATP-dependent DNA helicase PcrA
MSINYQSDLNPQQLKVVTEADGPCLVLAGAGSGKTRTLVYRVAYLLEKGINPGNILMVTFTNKAAGEMRERLGQLLHPPPNPLPSREGEEGSGNLTPSPLMGEGRGGGERIPPLWCGTFHHISNRILRRYASAIGFTSSFGILDQEDAKKLLQTCMESLDISQKGRIPIPKPSVVHAILSFASNAKRPIAEVIEEKYGALSPYLEDIQKVHQRYQKQKQQSNVMDFDDLLTKWLLLLSSFQPARAQLQERFQYILVDEYQDTNILQAEIIRWLAAKRRNILVVGDDAQSIYGFRAAEIRNILDFPKQYSETKTFYMEQNYRSTQPILELANEIIGRNFEQFPKKLFTDKKSEQRPFLIEIGDTYQQASFVARQIQILSSEDGIPLNELAVLFRARYQAARLELELTQRGIPYVVRGGIRFFEQAHIKDVVAWLKIFVNPKDSIAWTRVLSLFPGIGPKSALKILERLAKEEKPIQFFTNVGVDLRVRSTSIKECQALMEQLRKLPQKPGALLEPLIKEWYLPQLPSLYEESEARVEDLQQLLEMASRYELLEEFVSDVTLQEGFKGEVNNGHNRIVLSTIHQAKGLEWDFIFILSICDGQFPHSKVGEDSTEMEEERRLFYVAVTRARQQVYLLYPKADYSRQWGGLMQQNSTFLEELPEAVYDRKELVSDFSC